MAVKFPGLEIITKDPVSQVTKAFPVFNLCYPFAKVTC